MYCTSLSSFTLTILKIALRRRASCYVLYSLPYCCSWRRLNDWEVTSISGWLEQGYADLPNLDIWLHTCHLKSVPWLIKQLWPFYHNEAHCPNTKVPASGPEECLGRWLAFRNHRWVFLAGKPQQGQYPVGSTFHIRFQLPTCFKNISPTGGRHVVRENKNWTTCKTIKIGNSSDYKYLCNSKFQENLSQ